MKFHPPFFLFLAWWPSWLEVRINGHFFGRGPYKYHSTKVWLQLAQWFLRRRLKFTTYDGWTMTSDGKSSHGLWPGELKRKIKRNWQHRVHKTKKNKEKHNTICVGPLCTNKVDLDFSKFTFHLKVFMRFVQLCQDLSST